MSRVTDIDTTCKIPPSTLKLPKVEPLTLEQVLEPIKPQLDELPRLIQVAKTHCHYPSEHGLSKDESAAIYIYTMEWGCTSLYNLLNAALRSTERQTLKLWLPYLKLFSAALIKLPTVKGNFWNIVAADIGMRYDKNRIVTWWGITSCTSYISSLESVLEDRNHQTIFLIEATHAKQISGYGAFRDDGEVVLRMGSKFRVKDRMSQLNGSHIVHLMQLEDGNELQLH